MLTSLSLKGYRAFKSLKVEDLGQVNLFVGKNNCGKTTILEAAEILLSSDHPASIILGARRRGEKQIKNDREGMVKDEIDISHAFLGHVLDTDTSLKIEGANRNKAEFVEYKIITTDAAIKEGLLSRGPEELELDSKFSIFIKHSLWKNPIAMPLSSDNCLYSFTLRRQKIDVPSVKPVNFIRPELLPEISLTKLWNQIQLTPEEDHVKDALKIIEPKLIDLRFLTSTYRYYDSIIIKLEGVSKPLPLGSLGDGIKHLLSKVISIVTASAT